MARRMNPGSLAALVVLAVAVLFVAGSYIVSHELNRDAATTGNSASAPRDQPPARDQTTPPKPPLVDSNVPPAGGRTQ
jgi:hypothetical protein